jgi:hypothetical protein
MGASATHVEKIKRHFTLAATRWLRFLVRLQAPPATWYQNFIDEFASYMARDKGLSRAGVVQKQQENVVSAILRCALIGCVQEAIQYSSNKMARNTTNIYAEVDLEIGQAVFESRVRDSTIIASSTRPKASIISDVSCDSAVEVDQSVHSRGMAKLPRSGWRTLKVATPETVLSFRTTNL